VTLYLELLSSNSDLNVSFAQNKSAVVMWYKVVALKNKESKIVKRLRQQYYIVGYWPVATSGHMDSVDYKIWAGPNAGMSPVVMRPSALAFHV